LPEAVLHGSTSANATDPSGVDLSVTLGVAIGLTEHARVI